MAVIKEIKTRKFLFSLFPTKYLYLLILAIQVSSFEGLAKHPDIIELPLGSTKLDEYPNSPEVVEFSLGSRFPADLGGRVINEIKPLTKWPHLSTKGNILGFSQKGGAWWVEFQKYPHAEGEDEFVWTATDDRNQEANFTTLINIIGTNNPLQLFGPDDQMINQSVEIEMEEEQSLAASLTLWDPDPGVVTFDINKPDLWPTLTIVENNNSEDDEHFVLVKTLNAPLKVENNSLMNGWKLTYNLNWSEGVPNFEGMVDKDFEIQLRGYDQILKRATTWNLKIKITDKPEAPFPIFVTPATDPTHIETERSFPRNSEIYKTTDAEYVISEDQGDEILIKFKIASPDLDSNGKSKDIKIYYESSKFFNIENNKTWESLEEVSVKFQKAARFRVADIEPGISPDEGSIKKLEILDSGIGFSSNDFPLSFSILDGNASKRGGKLSSLTRILENSKKGSLVDPVVEESDDTFKVGDIVITESPQSAPFLRLMEGEESLQVSSLTEGFIKINFPNDDTFLPQTDFRFFAVDKDGTVEKDLDDEIEYPFFIAKITIENDYSDPISLDLSWPPDLQGDGKDIPNYRFFMENSTDLIADFDVVDPDSWPVEDLRVDNNKSSHEGALIRYNLEWANKENPFAYTAGDPDDIFTITEDGKLSFLAPPDFDTLYPQNTFELRVEVEDSKTIGSSGHTRTDDFQLFNIIIDNEDEPNVFIGSNLQPSEPPTYYISLPEDGVWEWRMSFTDLNGSQTRLAAKDLDWENTTESTGEEENNLGDNDFYSRPAWVVVKEPIKGFINPELEGKIELDSTFYQTRKWSVPKSLRYHADSNKIGYDEFWLSFGGTSPVKFIVDIINEADKPDLQKIYQFFGKEGSLDFNPTSNVHELYFFEDQLPTYRISFADLQDNDGISRIEVKKGVGDEDFFDVTNMQMGTDGFGYIDISLKELADYDQPLDNGFNNSYEIMVVVEDDSGESGPNNYNFILHNQNKDEGPKLILPDLFVYEESEIALSGIRAVDPEGEDKNFTWSILAGKGDWTYFDLNSSQGDSIDLLFKKPPSYEIESERDLNVTLLVTDGKETTSTFLNISVMPANDPPHFIRFDYNKTVEPSLIAIPDLNELVQDEDGDRLEFSINPDASKSPDLKFFDPVIAQGKTLLFKTPSDHEEKSSFRVSIIADDGLGGVTEGLVSIYVGNVFEPPQVRWTGDADQDFSFDDPIVEEAFWHFDHLKEDTPFEVNQLFFYDPEEPTPSPQNLRFEIIGPYEGSFTILDSPTTSGRKPNGRFLYVPPQDGHTFSTNPRNGERVIYREPYEVAVRVTDEMDQSIIFTFLFSVEDVPDPPIILLDEGGVENDYSTIDPLDSSLIRNNEGNENVVVLIADDSRDSLPSGQFAWSDPYGRDGALFKLVPILENQKEVLLKWDLTKIGGKPPDWADPPVLQAGLAPPEVYHVKVRLFGNPADKNETGDDTAELDLKIKLIDLANQPPQFFSTTLPAYREGSQSLLAGRVSAYDPDQASLVIKNEPTFAIHYELLRNDAFPDYQYFNKEIFDKDETSPSDHVGGELVFNIPPDFEYFMNSGIGATLEVYVKVREYGEDGYNGQESVEVIKIPLENDIEAPFFLPVTSDLMDANFSVAEESLGSFRVQAETIDYDKNLSLSFSLNNSLDNDLFTLSEIGSNDADSILANLSFRSPPDRESPRDFNKDNIYEVELNISTSDPSTWTLEKFKILVDDLDYPYEVSQENIIRIEENQAFVIDLEVIDQENSFFYPDLLLSNEEGSFYASNAYGDSATDPQFATQNVNLVGEKQVTSLSLAADFNKDGSLDVLSISESGAHIYQNQGYGTYSNTPVINFSDLTATITLPQDAIIHDFDQDGDQDVIISYYSFNGVGEASVYLFDNLLNENGLSFSNAVEIGKNWQEPRALLAADLDSDYDLDLVVADFALNQVRWMLNDGNAHFSDGGEVMNQDDGLVAPRSLESMDLNQVRHSLSPNPYQKPDLVIGALGKIFIAENNGQGVFTVRSILDDASDSHIKSVHAIKLDDDNLTDIVYLEGGKRNVFYSLGHGGFSSAEPIISPKLNLSISVPTSLEVYNYLNSEDKFQSLVLVGAAPANSSRPKVYQFGPASRTDENSGWEFVHYQVLPSFQTGPVKGSLYSLKVTDLDRAYNVYEFAIQDTLNFEEFDRSRIQSDGRLFFNPESIPDFENPLPGTENTYRLQISYQKVGSDALPKTELFQIEILDVNEPPKIKDFNNTASGVYQHLENIREVGLVVVDNPESKSEAQQELSFSITGGKDEKFFDIDPTTGVLIFIKAPDRERPKGKGVFTDSDHFYEVEIQAKELSSDGLSDQKIFLIEVIDGPENPVFSPDSQQFGPVKPLSTPFGTLVSISTSTEEDLEGGAVILMEDLNLTEPNPNGSFSNLRIFSEPSHGEVYFQVDGNETRLQEFIFSDLQTFQADLRKLNLIYISDANFSGFDKFTIEATSLAGIPARLELQVEVKPDNDAPAFFETITDTIYRDEGVVNVLTLKGSDSDTIDSDTLQFTLLDSLDSKWFAINQGVLRYLDPSEGLDFETKSSFQFELLLSSGATFDRQKETRKTITLQVINQADQPPISAVLEDSLLVQVFEGQSTILSLEAVDPDGFSTVESSLISGFDSDLFFLTQLGELVTINQTGLRFDSNDPNKNFYEVEILLEDSDQNNTYHVTIEVLDEDENPPVIVTGRSRAAHEVSVSEGTTFVYELIAEDEEQQNLNYSLEFGLDSDLFEIDVNQSAVLKFREAPDFENLTPSFFENGKYQVLLSVSDGPNSANQMITISVTDANDPPILIDPEFELLEDTPNFTHLLDVLDEDNDFVTISLEESTAFGAVNLFGNQVSYIPNTDFYGNDFAVLSLNDGTTINTQRVTFIVSPVNDPPVAVDDSKYFYQSNRTFSPVIQIDVLENDQTGPDDVFEKNFYQVDETFSSSASHGTVSLRSKTNGIFSYEPKSNFMGEDSFQYRLVDQDGLTDTATVRIWIATDANNTDWTNLMFFGMYYQDTNASIARQNWIYHLDMGWVYVHQPDQLLEATWLWHESIGWFWSGDKYFKWVYHDKLKQWLHWRGGINAAGGWFLHTQDETRYYEKDFIRLRVIDDVLAILPNLEGLSDYVYDNSFFTQSEKTLILRELALRGNSPTLNRILQFDFSY